MNINLMRHIDFWLGIPLCFALSVWSFFVDKLFGLNRPSPSSSQPKKILFIKLSEMGAIIVAHPLLKHIQKQYPNAEFHFLTFEKSREVLKLLGELVNEDYVHTIKEDSLKTFTKDTFQIVKRIRQEQYDIAIDLEFFSRFSAILTYLSNAPKRIGFYKYYLEGLYRGELLTHKVLYNPLIHTSKSYLALAQVIKNTDKTTPEIKEIGDEYDLMVPQIASTDDGRKSITERLCEQGFKKGSRIFLMNPGEGAIPLREWPLENFVSLAKQILKDEHNYVVLVGVESVNMKDKLLERTLAHKRCLNLTSQTSLQELLELFHISEAMIINDCGLAHLASLTPIKKFILFGPESPQIFAPLAENTWILYAGLYCSPCLSVLNHRNSACRDNQCLKVMSPEYVFETIQKNCQVESGKPVTASLD